MVEEGQAADPASGAQGVGCFWGFGFFFRGRWGGGAQPAELAWGALWGRP